MKFKRRTNLVGCLNDIINISCDYNSKLVSGFDKEGEGRKKQELIAMHCH